VSATPMGGGSTLVVFADQSAAVVDLQNGQPIVRQVITTSPQVLRAKWKDRAGTEHNVDTDCRNISIEECLRRHLDLVTKYQAAFPPA